MNFTYLSLWAESLWSKGEIVLIYGSEEQSRLLSSKGQNIISLSFSDKICFKEPIIQKRKRICFDVWLVSHSSDGLGSRASPVIGAEWLSDQAGAGAGRSVGAELRWETEARRKYTSTARRVITVIWNEWQQRVLMCPDTWRAHQRHQGPHSV